jgi:hypothetical protein
VSPEEDLDHTRLVELMVTQSESEADIIKGILVESGISCTLIAPVPHNLYPFTVNGLGSIRIMVLDTQLDAARAVLEECETGLEADADPEPESTCE